jgi:hypothetical protein
MGFGLGGGEPIPLEQISLNFSRHVRADVPAVQKVREAAEMTPQLPDEPGRPELGDIPASVSADESFAIPIVTPAADWML